MTTHKRFIAGAICPSCQAQDTLAIWRDNHEDIVECVNCHYQMRKTDSPLHGHAPRQEQLIGLFHPD